MTDDVPLLDRVFPPDQCDWELVAERERRRDEWLRTGVWSLAPMEQAS